MKLLLVSPCQYEHRRFSNSLRIPQISLNIIAALTPTNYEIKIVEEELEDVNYDEDCDIVGGLMGLARTRGFMPNGRQLQPKDDG